MTSGDLVRRLLQSFARRDDVAFLQAANAYIDDQRAKNHHVLARELERALQSTESRRGVVPLPTLTAGTDIPKDKDRNVTLVEVRYPERRLHDLVLDERVGETLQRILRESSRAEYLAGHGLKPMRKVLFCGPPGCGKTATAEAIARELHLPLVLVRFDAVVSSYLGETAANIRKVFDFARTRPMVLFFDEFDAIGKRRAGIDEHGELKRTVNSFLQILDAYQGEALTIAATNHQELLDPALWRRFDEIVSFQKPTLLQIREQLRRGLLQTRLAPSVDLDALASGLVGMSQADVERILLDSMKDMVLAGHPELRMDTLVEAIQRQHARIALTEPQESASPSEGTTEKRGKREPRKRG